jgi:hypothetical protein
MILEDFTPRMRNVQSKGDGDFEYWKPSNSDRNHRGSLGFIPIGGLSQSGS